VPGAHENEQPEVIVFGLGRYGGRLAHGLRQSGLKVMGVDFDPEVARRHGRHGLPTRYGDGADADFLESLPLAQARWVISTLPEVSANATLLDGLKSHQFKGSSIVVAREQADESKLKALGVGTVLNPMRDAVDNAIESLTGLVQGKA
jgi:Trk K+ transport system NAD-binding subunit